jgi:hypothetical protein
MTNLNVQVSSKKISSSNYFEATVDVDGLRPTKLERKADGSTWFSTRSALITAAKNIAKRLGYNNVRIIESGNAVIKRASKSIPPSTKTCKNKKKAVLSR